MITKINIERLGLFSNYYWKQNIGTLVNQNRKSRYYSIVNTTPQDSKLKNVSKLLELKRVWIPSIFTVKNIIYKVSIKS